MLGAAEALQTVEGDDTTYEVFWRTRYEKADDGFDEGMWIAVMVRYRVPGSNEVKQLNFWTMKYDPKVLTGNETANQKVQEL